MVASVRAISSVPFTLLCLIDLLRAAVQRPLAIDEPARCTTASAPVRPSTSISPVWGFHKIESSASWRLSRTRRMTLWPPVVRKSARLLPISPDAPVITTVKGGFAACSA